MHRCMVLHAMGRRRTLPLPLLPAPPLGGLRGASFGKGNICRGKRMQGKKKIAALFAWVVLTKLSDVANLSGRKVIDGIE